MEIQHYEMTSERLRFRRLRADDFALVSPILQDAQTMYAWEHPFTYEEVVNWISDMLRRYQEDGCGYFAGLDRETGELIALAGPLSEQVGENETAIGLGYIVRRSHWGQGYGTECARASIEFAFDKLDVPRVHALIRPNNLPSLHIAAACGMQPIGQMVKHYQGKDMPHIVCALERSMPTVADECSASDDESKSAEQVE